MTITSDTGSMTGTSDPDYNLLWFTEKCLDNAVRLEMYITDAQDAGDDELAEFFSKAQSDSRKGAEQAKAMLRSRLNT